jgi:chemotaxis protein methyltransferase CheR
MSAAKKMIAELEFNFKNQDLSQENFEFFAQLMYDISGVHLPESPKNEALVKNRLSKLLRNNKMNTYDDLRHALRDPDTKLLADFISSLTTNKTHFFREEAHFEWLQKYLPTHFQTHQELRVWCAASSTGQESYTIAMLLNEFLPLEHREKTKFLATDIDLQVLKKAVEGAYTENEMEGCPLDYRKKYFDKTATGFRAKEQLSKTVRFAQLNLMEDWPFQHKFHLIFCRNVLIYFDPPTTKRVINQMASFLAPKGHLILGHSESGTVKGEGIKPLTRAIYQKI